MFKYHFFSFSMFKLIFFYYIILSNSFHSKPFLSIFFFYKHNLTKSTSTKHFKNSKIIYINFFTLFTSPKCSCFFSSIILLFTFSINNCSESFKVHHLRLICRYTRYMFFLIWFCCSKIIKWYIFLLILILYRIYITLKYIGIFILSKSQYYFKSI